MPYYVAPEQVMKDRADYARKGIARGRSLAGIVCQEGILICAENPSNALHKVSEIYDRIAFAGVGKYNEFDQLRIAGIRHADLKGYSYSREDVDARSLANAYAQILGQIFTHEMKPLEVEILVGEVTLTLHEDRLYHVLYDGTVMDETQTLVLGGIIQKQISDTLRKTPILGDIPGLKWAFNKKDKTSHQVELLVFLRTTVVRTPEEAKELLEEVQQKTPLIKKSKELQPDPKK